MREHAHDRAGCPNVSDRLRFGLFPVTRIPNTGLAVTVTVTVVLSLSLSLAVSIPSAGGAKASDALSQGPAATLDLIVRRSRCLCRPAANIFLSSDDSVYRTRPASARAPMRYSDDRVAYNTRAIKRGGQREDRPRAERARVLVTC